MEIKIREEDEVIFVLFEVEDLSTEVERFLRETGFWDIRLGKPVILSGSCPGWALGILIDWFTFCPAVAVFNTEIKGARVVVTNSPKYAVGDIINLDF